MQMSIFNCHMCRNDGILCVQGSLKCHVAWSGAKKHTQSNWLFFLGPKGEPLSHHCTEICRKMCLKQVFLWLNSLILDHKIRLFCKKSHLELPGTMNIWTVSVWELSVWGNTYHLPQGVNESFVLAHCIYIDQDYLLLLSMLMWSTF